MDLLAKALLILVPMVFGAVGGKMAANRGRSFVLWGALSALFPIFIMIVYFEKPRKELPGGFKKCCSCGEWIKWKETPCHYCNAEQLKG